MAGAVEKVALGGIQSAVWGSLAMCVGALIMFNFLRTGG